jgi:hypothetical protein
MNIHRQAEIGSALEKLGVTESELIDYFETHSRINNKDRMIQTVLNDYFEDVVKDKEFLEVLPHNVVGNNDFLESFIEEVIELKGGIRRFVTWIKQTF